MATDDDAEMEEIKDGIKGYSLMPAVDNPKVDVRNGQGALFVYDMISMMDKNAIPTPVSESKMHILVDLEKKGFLRGIITANYKFARYFSPLHFNTPTDMESLYAQNEVELYRYGSDETENLAWPKGNNEDLVMTYNERLNTIIQREVGVDDGRETKFFNGGIMNYAK
jgi:arylsulfatase